MADISLPAKKRGEKLRGEYQSECPGWIEERVSVLKIRP